MFCLTRRSPKGLEIAQRWGPGEGIMPIPWVRKILKNIPSQKHFRSIFPNLCLFNKLEGGGKGTVPPPSARRCLGTKILLVFRLSTFTKNACCFVYCLQRRHHLLGQTLILHLGRESRIFYTRTGKRY